MRRSSMWSPAKHTIEGDCFGRAHRLLSSLSEVLPMKSIIIAGALLLATGCMKKAADGTYRVSPAEEKTRTAVESANEKANQAGQEIKEESKELGDEGSG